jgi:hypothetical protein
MATYFLEVNFKSEGAKTGKATIEYSIQYKKDSTNFLNVLYKDLSDGKYEFQIDTNEMLSYFLVGQAKYTKYRKFKPLELKSLSTKKDSPTVIEFEN